MLRLQSFEFGSFDLSQFLLKSEAGLLLEIRKKITNNNDRFAV